MLQILKKNYLLLIITFLVLAIACYGTYRFGKSRCQERQCEECEVCEKCPTDNNNDEDGDLPEEIPYSNENYGYSVNIKDDEKEYAILTNIKKLFTADERVAGEVERTSNIYIKDGKIYSKNKASGKETVYNGITNAKKLISVDTGASCDGANQLTVVLTTDGKLYINRIVSNAYHNIDDDYTTETPDSEIEYKMYFTEVFNTYGDKITDIKEIEHSFENQCTQREIFAVTSKGLTRPITYDTIQLFNYLFVYIYPKI